MGQIIKWFHFTFQNIQRLTSVGLDWLHDFSIFFLIFILIVVRLILLRLIINQYLRFFLFESSYVEIIWTILPAFILIFLGVPSLIILYQVEKNFFRNISLKITGHQWFWSYDIRDFLSVEFDSYILPVQDLELGDFRLLITDNHLVLPVNSNRRILISSSDVLHRWTLPSLGIKVDANPGRINILFSYFPVCGYYFGQCSEICGANHSFIPICVEVVTFRIFKNWIKKF